MQGNRKEAGHVFLTTGSQLSDISWDREKPLGEMVHFEYYGDTSIFITKLRIQ